MDVVAVMRFKTAQGAFVLNPSLSIEVALDIRRRGQSFEKQRFALEDNLDVIHVLSRLIKAREAKKTLPKSLRDQVEFLVQAGILVPESEAPRSVEFEHPLGAKFLEKVPATHRHRAQQLVSSGELVLATGMALQPTTRGPAFPAGIPPGTDFPQKGPLLWVQDPGTQMWVSYQISDDYLETLKSLRADATSINKLDPAVAEILCLAECLVPADHRASRIAACEQQVSQAFKRIKSDQFAVMKGILPPLQIAALREYYRALRAEGFLTLDRDQVKEKRFFVHNETVSRFFHRQTGALIRRLTGEALIPSYTFISAYIQGAELERHTDRPQCAWNASMLIDHLPETGTGESWPIYLETAANQPAEVRLELGDAVFYRGSEVPHWRPRLPQGEEQTLMLFHYVPMEFTGDLN